MKIAFEQLQQASLYNRHQLARLWDCKSIDAIRRGIVTPSDSNTIVLFITQKQKGSLVSYRNQFDGELLWMDGETGHGHDDRLATSLDRDEVHLFFRREAGNKFRYEGRVYLAESFINSGDEPSRFLFAAQRRLIATVDFLADDAEGEPDGDPEGKRSYRLHLVYERSKRNREAAIDLHGTRCLACNFDFDDFYGSDLARSYIEIHHLKSVTLLNGAIVNPSTDLIPLCSNCHRMAHRRFGTILSLDELKQRVTARRSRAAIGGAIVDA